MGAGWSRVVDTGGAPPKEDVTAAFLCWFLGCVVVDGALFATGSLLYGQLAPGLSYAAVAAGAGIWLFRTLPRVGIVR